MKKILIIEDDIHVQRLLMEDLVEDGFAIDVASNGKEALKILNGNGSPPPDLIILDIRMPRMDGLDTMGHLLKSRFVTPVIIHTAYAGYRKEAMAMAADAYVIKSPDTRELKNKIHDLLDA